MDEIIRTLFFSPLLQGTLLLTLSLYAGMILWFLKGWINLPVFEEICRLPDEKISVIIPCRNEQENLPDLIRALTHQSYPAALTEIFLVDDHSTDHTGEIMELAAKEHARIKTLRNRGKGKKEALLTGAEACTSSWIFTTDADARPDPHWLAVMTAYRKNTKAGFVAGPVKTFPQKKLFSRFRELEFYSLMGAGMGAAGTGHPLYCNGANMAYDKNLLSLTSDPLHKKTPSGDDVFLLHTVKRYQPESIHFLKSRKATVTFRDKAGPGMFLRQRSRWASKSPAYRDRDTLLTAGIVFLTNLIIVFSITAGFLRPAWWFWALFFYLIKSIPDFLLLHSVTSFYNRRNLIRIFPLAQLFYPFYITVTTLAGISSYPFKKKGWMK
ncbi:MAG: glycosyltransferase [Bacteroidales bacterium]|nr:glycosyltransferase [Bacteroidales bacterium]